MNCRLRSVTLEQGLFTGVLTEKLEDGRLKRADFDLITSRRRRSLSICCQKKKWLGSLELPVTCRLHIFVCYWLLHQLMGSKLTAAQSAGVCYLMANSTPNIHPIKPNPQKKKNPGLLVICYRKNPAGKLQEVHFMWGIQEINPEVKV